jgi:hypothetical protein
MASGLHGGRRSPRDAWGSSTSGSTRRWRAEQLGLFGLTRASESGAGRDRRRLRELGWDCGRTSNTTRLHSVLPERRAKVPRSTCRRRPPGGRVPSGAVRDTAAAPHAAS